MCVETEQKQNSEMFNRLSLSRALHATLTHAKVNRRLICGLLPTIAHLQKSAEDVIFCLLPQARPGDASDHMQTVLLQAFCYENYIPVIQVDNSEKLAAYCGISKSTYQTGCICAIVTRDRSLPSTPEDEFPMSPPEQMLTNFYERSLEQSSRPVIELPS